jgi:hypothetical protein
MEVSCQIQASTTLPPREAPCCPVSSRLPGLQELLWTLWRGDKSACSGNRTRILRFSRPPDITQCVVRLWGERVGSEKETSFNDTVGGVSEVNPDKPHNSWCSVAVCWCRRLSASTFFSVHCVICSVGSCEAVRSVYVPSAVT